MSALVGPYAASWIVGKLVTPQVTWDALTSTFTQHATMLLGLGAGAASSITLTGTLAYVGNVCPGLRVRIDTTGVGVLATFSTSVDNGANYTAQGNVAATFAVPGTTTTLNFSLVTNYVANDIHRAVITRVASVSGGKNLDQATVTKCPEFFTSLLSSGYPGLLAEGTLRATELVCTDATVAGYGADAKTLTVNWTGYTALADSLQAFCAFAAAVSSNRTFRMGTTTTDLGSWHTDKVSNAGGAGATLNGYPSSAKTSVNVRQTFSWRFSGTTAQLRIGRQPQLPVYDAGANEGGSGAFVPGVPTTTTKFSLFARSDSGPDSQLDGGWHRTSLWNTVLSDADNQADRAAVTATYGLAKQLGIGATLGDSILGGFVNPSGPDQPLAAALAAVMPGLAWTDQTAFGQQLATVDANVGTYIRLTLCGSTYQAMPFGTGTNDVRNFAKTDVQVNAYIASIMSKLALAGVIGLPVTIPDCTDGAANTVFASINATTRSLYGNRVIDLQAALVAAGAVPGAAPWYSDGVHLTALGYNLLFQLALAALNRCSYPS